FGPLGRVPKAAVPGAAGLTDGPITALVRPEAVVLQLDAGPEHAPAACASGLGPDSMQDARGEPPAGLAASAVIVDVIFGGERSLVKVSVDGRPWTAAAFGAAAREALRHVGRPVSLWVPLEAVRVLPPG